jgi:MFS family permease
MQVPSNLFLNKIGKPAIYLPTCMIVWGMISALTAACQSYGGLIACRFMLGFVEAAYFVSQDSSLSKAEHSFLDSQDVSTFYHVGTLELNLVYEPLCSIPVR